MENPIAQRLAAQAKADRLLQQAVINLFRQHGWQSTRDIIIRTDNTYRTERSTGAVRVFAWDTQGATRILEAAGFTVKRLHGSITSRAGPYLLVRKEALP